MSATQSTIELDTEQLRREYVKAVGNWNDSIRRGLVVSENVATDVAESSSLYVAALEAEMTWNGTKVSGVPS